MELIEGDVDKGEGDNVEGDKKDGEKKFGDIILMFDEYYKVVVVKCCGFGFV